VLLQNVKAAGITYWYIAALDPWTSKALGALGVTDHCFNAPMDQLGYRGEGALILGRCDCWGTA
jgi:hypothetical protein